MKYIKLAKEFAEETSKMLHYNKYLLDDPKLLATVLELRAIQPLGDAYRQGKSEKIVYSDMSHLQLDVRKGFQ